MNIPIVFAICNFVTQGLSARSWLRDKSRHYNSNRTQDASLQIEILGYMHPYTEVTWV